MIWINLKTELTRKRGLTKNTWYDCYEWLINYIPELKQKTVGGIKDQIVSLFKIKGYSEPEPVKIVYKGAKKQSEENITKSIRKLFKLKKRK